jgi:hypothetical protein
MTPESVPGLRVTLADIRPIWLAIAHPHNGAPAASVSVLEPEPPQSINPTSLAA